MANETSADEWLADTAASEHAVNPETMPKYEVPGSRRSCDVKLDMAIGTVVVKCMVDLRDVPAIGDLKNVLVGCRRITQPGEHGAVG